MTNSVEMEKAESIIKEACSAWICDPPGYTCVRCKLKNLIAQALADERRSAIEECAKVAETPIDKTFPNGDFVCGELMNALEIAKSIRSILEVKG